MENTLEVYRIQTQAYSAHKPQNVHRVLLVSHRSYGTLAVVYLQRELSPVCRLPDLQGERILYALNTKLILRSVLRCLASSSFNDCALIDTHRKSYLAYIIYDHVETITVHQCYRYMFYCLTLSQMTLGACDF